MRAVRNALLAGIAGVAWLLAGLPAQAQTKWDLSSMMGATHPVTLHYKGFSDEVKKRTDGKLDIIVRPAGELPFKATEVVKAAGAGNIQLGEAYQGFISGSIPLASIASLPFLVRTPDELAKVYPIIEKYTKAEFEKNGVRVLYWFSWPVQNVFGKGKPIRTAEDFVGRKIRTTDAKQSEMMKRLGGSAVTITPAEVPVAMERGVAEGFFTAAFNVMGAKWYEFVQWGWVGQVHVGGPDYLLMNIDAYKKLDPKVREALDAVAKEWGPKTTEQIQKDEITAFEDLKTKHKVEIIKPTEEQVAPMTAKMKEYWDTWAKQHGANGEAMLKEIRTALGR
ncbi:MAG: TRAP transporter substrate-binding protein DctP [Hyphomicrobiaceae bacterium]|nr:TRAP transporter substrate-binding protein DctP [Hyphomicrobiaceae bacterium]